MSARRKLRKLLRDPRAFLADARPRRALASALTALGGQAAGDTEPVDAASLFDFDAHEPLLSSARGRYLYVPWIAAHGDALLSLIDPQCELLVPFPFFRSPDKLEQRTRISAFVRERPEQFRRLLLRALLPLKQHIAGVVLTLDWVPPTRQVAYCCRELGIRTVLIPHESVFADRSRYYRDPLSGADYPVCDVALCWGHLQRDVFAERGYPEDRLRVVGSPKLDAATRYTPRLGREAFLRLYGLDPARKIVLFAMQPLDSQYDAKRARDAQNRAISDLLTIVERGGEQLLVRHPPSGHDILAPALRHRLEHGSRCAIDDGKPYMTGPHESIHHTDACCSINSTMLLEAMLMGRPAISTPYEVRFEDLWSSAKIPVARDGGALEAHLSRALAGAASQTGEGRAWAAHAFSNGEFDGQSGARICGALRELRTEASSAHGLLRREAGVARAPFGTAALFGVPSGHVRTVRDALCCRTVLEGPSLAQAQSADLIVHWGGHASDGEAARCARLLGRPLMIASLSQDGLIFLREA